MNGPLTNNYADVISPALYEKLPKAVLAALLVSVLSNGGDHFEVVEQKILDEWWVLFHQEIVTQKPPRILSNSLLAG